MDETTVTPAVRLRTDITEIHDWQDVDVALGCLRLLDSRLDRISAEHDQEVQRIQEAKKRRSTPLVERKTRIEILLEKFVSEHRADWGPKKKSLKVVHGKVGFRWATPKVDLLQDEDQVKRLLKANGQGQCVKSVEELDKTAIKRVPAALLHTCGVQILQEERFFYELTKEEIVEYPGTLDESEQVPA